MKGNFKIGDKIKFINHIKNVGNNFDIVFCYKHSGILNSDKNANFIISKNEGFT